MFCQGAIDARSSKPLVKEDDVEHEKRRASAEKHKSMQDIEKKKEKRKNLERQALEEHRAKARREGEPEEDSPDEDDGDNDNDDEDSKGTVARLDHVLQGLPQTDVSSSRAGASKGPQSGDRDERQKEVSPHARTLIRPLPPPRVGLLFRCDLPKLLALAIESRPLERGR